MAARALGGCAALYEKNRVLALGQFISLLIALTGVFTQTLNQSFQVRSLLRLSCCNVTTRTLRRDATTRSLMRSRVAMA